MRSPLVLSCWLAFLPIAAAAIAAPAADPAPRAVAADPALLLRLGAEATARSAGPALPEAELYRESRDARKSGRDVRTTGTGSCLVVLVGWTDHPADVTAHPNAAYQQMLFSVGIHPTGSLNDFYLENSHGLYQVQGLVSGWHVAADPYANIDPTNYLQVRSMIAAVMTQLDPVIDYSQFDNDGPDGVPHSYDDDGLVDALFFVHAGPGREQTGSDDDIWSHAWSFNTPLATADGVALKRYTVEPEETMDGAQITMGVFAHEYGHVLGLPDLYDSDYSSSGVGEWCLMGSGSWGRRPGDPAGSSPTHMSAWCKAQLGWVSPVAVTAGSFGVNVPPAEISPTAYRVFRDGVETGDEYFLVENRQPLGFDAALTRRQVDFGLPPASGLVVYHVNEAVSGNADEKHRLVDVVEASPWFRGPGDWFEHLDGPRDYAQQLRMDNFNRGDNGDAWPGWSAVNADTTDWNGPRDRNRFADDTIPPASDIYCDPTGVALENIALSGQDVTLDFVLSAKRAPRVEAGKSLTWDFESDTDGWLFCHSFAHRDESMAGSCSGDGGLWFGIDDPEFECGPGYGNNWYDFAWTTAGVSAETTITLRHRYDIEPDYDFAYVEGRCAGDPGAPWMQIAALTGASSCVTDTWEIPPALIGACDNDYGFAVLDLRLRLATDGGWSAEDGNFCGFGWWVDEVILDGEYATGAGETPGAGLAQLLPASPNPFNPATVLRYCVPAGAREVRLAVFDQRGRRVRTLDAQTAAGWHESVWDGRDDEGRARPSGVYFARYSADSVFFVEKLALLK
ncbi:MAG: M6 family metalloprotease domain-containing protein [Candidatus Latescibacteria bacterium]|nr:M6 family metalloprotease domain-containing protein [Candidatus Latescibacterota bacterium]